jgi:hypothetical protein
MEPKLKKHQVTFLYIIIHVSAWMILFLLPFAIFDLRFKSPFSVFNVIFIAKAIVIFYLNYFILVPKLLLQKRALTYVLSFFLVLALMVFTESKQSVKRNPANYPDDTEQLALYQKNKAELPETLAPPHSPFGNPRMFGNLSFLIMIFGVSASLKLSEAWFNDQKQQQDIKKEHLATELAFLKSQINPHFLFNSLNSIYSLAFKKSDLAPESILRLSKIMRYVLDESSNTCVSIEKELEHLQDYVELQKLRLTDKTKFSLVIENKTSHQTIEPMLLVPFVENAFKHGADTSNNSVITIKINAEKNQLVFRSTNTIAQRNIKSKDTESGIGLKNVERRLQMLYPGNHKLEVLEENNLYAVTLFLTLKSNEMPHR